jgi:zinc/manganese transport system permease protein
MRHALVGCLALALGCEPIGTILVIRRMSLMVDALSHTVLPGAALGFIIAGLSLPPMSLSGVVAGLVVALLSGLMTRLTPLREDASFAGFYLISLVLGVLLVSIHGSNIDLSRLLFGSILAVDDTALDPDRRHRDREPPGARSHLPPARGRVLRLCFSARRQRSRRACPRAVSGTRRLQHGRRVSGARHVDGRRADDCCLPPPRAFGCASLWSLSAASTALALGSGFLGLLLSYPSGPAIVLVAGLGYLASVALGPRDSLSALYVRRAHLEA